MIRRVAATASRAAAAVLCAVALAPVTLVAVLGVAVAWYNGWQPRRLYRAAIWCLPPPAVWLLAMLAAGHPVESIACEPAAALLRGDYVAALLSAVPTAVPLGLLAGGWAWSMRLTSMAARTGGRSPAAAVNFELRQWRHQVRAARARIARPVPLLAANGDVVIGAVIRAVGHPDRTLARLPASRLRAHQVVIGGTGMGKTTLLLRLWAAFMASGLCRHAAGEAGAPLLVILDCKGGADARRTADNCRRVLQESGSRNVAVWPDDARLSLWSLPEQHLVTTLVDLIEHGVGGAAYYADVLEAIVALAVEAPAGPPASTADFLARLEPAWLARAWLGDEDRSTLIRSAARQVPDVALRFRTLFRRLGIGLDGPGAFTDADAWYCILEGTAEVAVAEAQARALVDLLTSYVASADRQVLLAVDEYSAVSRRLPIWQLYERARSLGLTVQASAQSWHGLAEREDDRYRLAATAEGGVWLLQTPYPEPLTGLVGQHSRLDSTRELTGRLRWSRAGTSRIASAPVADPERIRAFDPGQAAYLHHGGVTYIQIQQIVAAPAPPSESPAAVGHSSQAQSDQSQPRHAESAHAPRASAADEGVAAFLDQTFGRAQ